MKIPVRLPLAGALMAGFLWNSAPAWSQTQTESAPLQTRLAYEIPVANVSAHLLAYWLDPSHQATPPELGLPVHEKFASAPRPANAKPSPFDLPTGIDKIVADDDQKKLLVFGTEEAVQKLRQTVAFLDQPRRQVELETRLLFVKSEDVRRSLFGQKNTPVGQPAPQGGQSAFPTSVGFHRLPADALPLVTERIRTGQMSELVMPRLTVYSNLSAPVEILRSHPIPRDLQNKVAALVPQGVPNSPLELQTPLKIKLTPTINNDDTVTVLLETKGQTQFAYGNASDVLPLGKPSGLQVIANAKDGETIALSGFDPNFASAFTSAPLPKQAPVATGLPSQIISLRSNQALSGEMVLLLTPRIVRR